ncbi:hypothetical protein [Pseudomonas mandelii]|uniref:hypothetical protein n=1 Tax=Pseudomonas mandelii TaxID=75612 RepID=UPI00224B0A7A|nr:hypothetical protein [Pseudomonas mandelii]MCX2898532.1 hypothetical protein [Pseudomonas mandelii]
MIRSWIKYFFYFLGGCVLLISCGIYWLKGEAQEAWEVMDRFGGNEVVGDRSIIPVGMDEIYMRSLRLKLEPDVMYDIRALKPCSEYSQNCLIQDSARINLDLISTGIVLKDADEFLKKYKTDPDFFEGACPVIYETTAIIKELTGLRRMTDRKAQAKETMGRITRNGGLTYSLDTPQCLIFFRQKPYMARAYLGYLAMLMSFAEGRFSASSLILSELPSIRSTIR